MKSALFRKALGCILLALLLIPGINALAEEEYLQYGELELFTHGAIPQPQGIMLIADDDFDTYVADQLRAQATEIYVRDYNMTKDTLLTAMSMLINDNPDLFYVSSEIGYYITSTGYITRIVPQYLYTGDDLQSRIDAFNASVDEIAAFASQATTDVGKLLRLNDYFCVHYQYDDSLTIYSPDLLFSGGTGVCQAYMLGYAAVLDELGIANTHATSYAMSHTWNVVQLDGSWYHIDATWNDSSTTNLFAGHDYFLLSDTGITAASHYDWISSVAAVNTKYDSFFWQGIETPFGTAGDSVVYLDPDVPDGVRTICRWDANSETTEAIRSFDILSEYGSYVIYSGIEPITSSADRIFYASRSRLISVAHDGSDPRLIYDTGDDAVHIWSCWLENGTIYMLAGDPQSTLNVITCSEDDQITLSISNEIAYLAPDETLQLSAALSKDLANTPTFTWASSNEAVATVDETGLVTAEGFGAATVTARYADGAEGSCSVIVHGEKLVTIPSGTTAIEFEAFLNSAAEEVVLPEGLQSIGVRSFGNCESLKLVHIPDSVSYISAVAFSGSENVTLLCAPGSYSESYALSNGIRCVLLPETAE